jgi:hypothetical protein
MVKMKVSYGRSWPLQIALAAILAAVALPTEGQDKPAATKVPDLTGIYDAVPLGTTLPGGLKGSGTLADIGVTPAAIAEAKKSDLDNDPAKVCQVIGPFRMMARGDNKIEMVTSPDRITEMFQDGARGNMRNFWTQRKHPAKPAETWMGDSVASWEGDTLVVDSVGFNDRTWLNDAGVKHTEDLHLVERYRLLQGGNILEVKMTAEDPKTLLKPYTYTRYYERSKVELRDYWCGREP